MAFGIFTALSEPAFLKKVLSFSEILSSNLLWYSSARWSWIKITLLWFSKFRKTGLCRKYQWSKGLRSQFSMGHFENYTFHHLVSAERAKHPGFSQLKSFHWRILQVIWSGKSADLTQNKKYLVVWFQQWYAWSETHLSLWETLWKTKSEGSLLALEVGESSEEEIGDEKTSLQIQISFHPCQVHVLRFPASQVFPAKCSHRHYHLKK